MLSSIKLMGGLSKVTRHSPGAVLSTINFFFVLVMCLLLRNCESQTTAAISSSSSLCGARLGGQCGKFLSAKGSTQHSPATLRRFAQDHPGTLCLTGVTGNPRNDLGGLLHQLLL